VRATGAGGAGQAGARGDQGSGKEWSVIKAIPTTHRGIKMRSRLEASFAQALDEFKIEWAYEAEGFDIDGTWYLPDFWIPSFNAFVEVKGIIDDSVERPRKLAGSLTGGRRIFLADPQSVKSWQIDDPRLIQLARRAHGDREAVLARCPTCKSVDMHSSRCCISVYLAGKVSGIDDWRMKVVPGLRSSFQSGTEWEKLTIKSFFDGKHTYSGPFF
jgi:hypothetical protein